MGVASGFAGLNGGFGSAFLIGGTVATAFVLTLFVLAATIFVEGAVAVVATFVAGAAVGGATASRLLISASGISKLPRNVFVSRTAVALSETMRPEIRSPFFR